MELDVILTNQLCRVDLPVGLLWKAQALAEKVRRRSQAHVGLDQVLWRIFLSAIGEIQLRLMKWLL